MQPKEKKIPSWTHTSKIYLKNNTEVEDVRERMEVKYQLDRWKAQYTCPHTNAAHCVLRAYFKHAGIVLMDKMGIGVGVGNEVKIIK